MIVLLGQLVKFGCVGVLSTAVHYVVAILLMRFAVPPMWANLFAFITAFQVSFWGHYRWTFAAMNSNRGQAFRRFLVIALSGFALNEAFYYTLLRWTTFSPEIALLWVLGFVAGLTFLISRYWAFHAGESLPPQ